MGKWEQGNLQFERLPKSVWDEWDAIAKPPCKHVMPRENGLAVKVLALCRSRDENGEFVVLDKLHDCLDPTKMAKLSVVAKSESILPRVFVAKGNSDSDLIRFEDTDGELSRSFHLMYGIPEMERMGEPVCGEMATDIITNGAKAKGMVAISGDVEVIRDTEFEFKKRGFQIELV